jgi:Rrf2 family transcriptional regulator, cysteine metabolism repressor
MHLSQSVTYALQALLQLVASGDGALVTRGKLAADGKMPERFLLEILHDLVKRGILRSTRGGGGGFALARRPEQITLLDVIEAVDGPVVAEMPAGTTMQDSVRNRLSTILEEVAKQTRARLAGVTLNRFESSGMR